MSMEIGALRADVEGGGGLTTPTPRLGCCLSETLAGGGGGVQAEMVVQMELARQQQMTQKVAVDVPHPPPGYSAAFRRP